MRLGVNARRLAGQRLGIGRYIEYMAKYWAKMVHPSDNVTIYVQEPLRKGELRLSDAFRIRPLPSRFKGVLWENLVLSLHAKENDVLFGPSYTVPLTNRGRSVVATHSVNEVQPGTHPWSYHLTYSLIYRLSAQKADKVIVPSQTVKRDIQKYYGIAAGKIEIIPEGADDAFQPIEDQEVLRSTRQQYLGADKPYILYVGKLSQRRNIPLLLAAFAAAKKRERIPHSLLLMGPNHLGLPVARMAEELGISDSLVHTNREFADHRELVPLYSAADLYVYPSSYEGFSLTTVEALACGVPVVAANRAALAEIAGGHALMVDDLTVEAFAEAIARVVTDRQLHADLRAKGQQRARSLRWEDTAQRTLDVLRQVAQA